MHIPQSDPSASSAAPAEGLPNDEPLTPELLEDEALRGDVMLRWAVVLLALLLGCTEIGDTQTLVHVKTGQYLLSHGVLPPRNDVFSSTATDRPWTNLSWLFDIALAGAYAAGGAIGLTVFKSLLSALTFWFVVNTGVKGVSTWWTSTCAAMALLVAHFQFGALPDLITLLGLAVMLWLIQRWVNGDMRTLWAVPVVFLFWSNLDPRMWVGLAMLILFFAGEMLGRRLHRSMLDRDDQRRHLGMVVAASVVACLINPFGWKSLTAPATLYGVEYPALREAYDDSFSWLPATTRRMLPYVELQLRAMFDRAFWERPTQSSVTIVVLAVAAAIAIGLNHRRFSWSHVLMSLGVTALAVKTAREIPPAAIVLAWVAGWNGQIWYRSTFRQSYSTDRAELIFSRGGRIVTVLALTVVAGVAISGRLPMPGAVRNGFGWQPTLATYIEGSSKELDDMYDDRPFNFLLRQGDIFLWIGKRPFVDHRVAIFKGTGDADLLDLHDRTARALRRPNREAPGTGDRALWRQTFDDYQITHVVPSLLLPFPDYDLAGWLLLNPLDFQLVRVGNSSMVYCRRPAPSDRQSEGNRALLAYLQQHKISFAKDAFRTPPPEDAARVAPLREWPAVRTNYQILFRKERPLEPAPIQEARHYYMLWDWINRHRMRLLPEDEVAFWHLIIRKVNAGLLEYPNHDAAYQWLGDAYSALRIMESQPGTLAEERRSLQAIQAYSQSLLLDPNQIDVHFKLFQAYHMKGRIDLALKHLDEGEQLLTQRRVEEAKHRTLGEGDYTLPKEWVSARQQLESQVAAVAAAIETARKDSERPPSAPQLAQIAYQRGCPLMALELLDGDKERTPNPAMEAVRGRLLLEAGRPEEAAAVFDQLEGVVGKGSAGDIRFLASVACLAQGDQARAAEFLKAELGTVDVNGFAMLADSLPLVGSRGPFPLSHMVGAQGFLYQIPQTAADLRLQIAMSHLEAGRQKQASAALRDLLKFSPESRYRDLAISYLGYASQEFVEREPPSDWIPISKDLFAPEEKEPSGGDSRESPPPNTP